MHKAYLNARGGPAILNLTHDVKRCVSESGSKSGYIHVVSTGGTTAVLMIENDAKLQKEYLDFVKNQFVASSAQSVARRSRTGPNRCHHMAAFVGLSLTVAFDEGKLLASPFHDIIVFDFEPSPGRREFILTVIGASKEK